MSWVLGLIRVHGLMGNITGIYINKNWNYMEIYTRI